MGIEHHHVIVVQDYDIIRTNVAHQLATDLGMNPTSIVKSRMNDWYSFMIPADGSKDGWPESDEGDVNRYKFMHHPDVKRLCHVIEYAFGELGYTMHRVEK